MRPNHAPDRCGRASQVSFHAYLDGLLTAPQVAELLQISPRTLWAKTNCGEIKCVRIGSAVRYRTEDVQAFIDSLVEGGVK